LCSLQDCGDFDLEGHVERQLAMPMEVRTIFISVRLAIRVWATRPFVVRRPPVQTVRRPLPHLVAYGSTNKYRPVNRSKASGTSAKRPTQTAG